MLIRGGRLPVPRVVRDRGQQLAASQDGSANQTRVDDLVADGRARLEAIDRQRHHGLARREIGDRSHQRGHEEQQPLERDVLAKRHEVHLAVDAGRAAVGTQDERRVVVRRRLAALDLIASEQEIDPGLAHDGADPIGVDTVFLEVERRRRLRPHDKPRPSTGGLPGHRQVALEDGVGSRRIPFLILRDVALHEGNAGRPTLPCQRIVAHADVSPPGYGRDEHANGHGRQRRLPGADRHNIGQSGVAESHERGHPIHSEQARELRNRQGSRLAVPQQDPRKPAPEM